MDPRMYVSTPEQMGGPAGIMDAINKQQMQSAMLAKQLYENMQTKAQAQYAPQNALSDMLKNQYAAQQAGITTQYLPQNLQSEIQQRLAQALASRGQANELNANANKTNQMLPGELTAQGITNQYLPQTLQADINYKNMGGGRVGVALQDLNAINRQVQLEHPDWDQNRVKDAVSNYMNGNSTFTDGKPLPAASGQLNNLLSNAFKRTTTAQALNKGIAGNQAEAELNVLDKEIGKDVLPYQNTFFGRSPEQIAATFSSDPEEQKKLGRFIAGQAIQYEISQNRIKLAGGQPGVHATEDLMRMSQQLVKDSYPMLSATARQEAARRMDEILEKGLAARQKVGVNPMQLSPGSVNQQFNQSQEQEGSPQQKVANSVQSSSRPRLKYNLQTGSFE